MLGFYEGHDPVAVMLSETMRCEDCEYPCVAKEYSSYANCEHHMQQLLEEKKIGVVVYWNREIELKRSHEIKS